MISSGSIVVLFLLFGIVAPVVLYYLVRDEHNQREQMDRECAERTARRDTRERTPNDK